jgi:hypothetical protein
MELPDVCPSCHQTNMVDWENMEKRLISKIYTVYGYSCPKCGKWKPSFYTTRQLEENIRRLMRMSPNHPSFQYHLIKAAKRAEEIQRRGRIASGSI